MKNKKNRNYKSTITNNYRPYDREGRRQRAELATKEQRKPKRIVDYLTEYDENGEYNS